MRDAGSGVQHFSFRLSFWAQAFAWTCDPDIDGPLFSVPHPAFCDVTSIALLSPGDLPRAVWDSHSPTWVSEREGPAGDVSQRTALWSVSIRVRAGRSKHTPEVPGSLVPSPQAPIASPETDDRFVPS